MDHFLSLCPTKLSVDLLEERLAAAEKSILAIGASRGNRRTPFFERCSSHWQSSWGGVWAATHYAALHRSVELPRWHYLLMQNVPIFDLDFDAILASMYALTDSAEGDCYLSVLPNPSIAAAALGASASAAPGTGESATPGAGELALSGTAPTEALHTFTLDSGASRSFFRDSTTLTPLNRPVAVSLADPSGGPVLAHSSTVLLCPAAPSGLLSGLHLPSFSTNLVSRADLQDAWVDQFTLGGQRVTHCTCSRTGRHLATFTHRPWLSLYTLTTASPPVSASGQVAASRQEFAAASRSSPASAPCSCRPLSHETFLWHHRLGHPSLPRLRGMASRTLGRQLAAPNSSTFPPTEAPLQTLHMDVWCPARVRGQGHERYFLLVVDNYSRYTTVFPLRSKGEVPEVLIDWIRGARHQLSERSGLDLPVLRLHSDRGGEFSYDLLRAFFRAEGIRKTFTLPASPQQNGIAERRIGMVMDVACTYMIHAAAPHFLWPFAVQYAAHQINLQPRVSLPETTPTLRWTGKVGDASAFRVWGSRAFVRDTSADKLSSFAVPCVFLGFPPDASEWQFYHPTSRRVVSSQDVTFDESVSYYRIFPYRTASLPPPPLFLGPVDHLGAARGAEPAGAGTGGAELERVEPGGAESGDAKSGLSGPGGIEPGRVEPKGTACGGAEPACAESRGALGVTLHRDYELHSLDFSRAFLQGSLHEEIWLRRPPGLTGSFPAGTQWSLRRPVYSLRQAPREWHDTLRSTLGALGFAPSTSDPSLFLRTDTALPPFYVLVYVLQRFGFTYSSPPSTPLPTGHSLSAPPSDESVEQSGSYPELVGCLITSGMGLVLRGRARVVLTGHADASWVDDLARQRWSEGYTFSLGSGSISWRSTRSSSVLSSSCEAEIYPGAMAAQELRWLTYLLADLGEAPRSPPVLYQRGQLRLAYVASQANTADVFTKALQPCDHQPCFAFLDWSCDLFSYVTLVVVIVLEKELAAISMRLGCDVKPVLDKTKNTYLRMVAAGCKVSELQQCNKIISELDNSWDNLIPTLNTQQDLWTPEWLWQKILLENFRRRHVGGGAAN
ncbi:unnamed protein product [Closterium sp. NIES-53]